MIFLFVIIQIPLPGFQSLFPYLHSLAFTPPIPFKHILNAFRHWGYEDEQDVTVPNEFTVYGKKEMSNMPIPKPRDKAEAAGAQRFSRLFEGGERIFGGRRNCVPEYKDLRSRTHAGYCWLFNETKQRTRGGEWTNKFLR